MLKHVAEIFGKNCPNGAEVYRWGGEEFIIALPDKTLSGAAEAAEKLRTAAEASPCCFEDLEIKVTMSFGCTETDPAKTIEENISIADEKLYSAKENGRNRVVS